jgi:predicted PurR-regulated permease PerM
LTVVPPPGREGTLLAVGRRAWALLGIAAVIVLAWWVAGRLAIVVVPLLLVLFPAALLMPALVIGKVTRVSAFTVIVAVTAGATLLGALGAFLAVPVAACAARVLESP